MSVFWGGGFLFVLFFPPRGRYSVVSKKRIALTAKEKKRIASNLAMRFLIGPVEYITSALPESYQWCPLSLSLSALLVFPCAFFRELKTQILSTVSLESVPILPALLR